MAYNKTEHLRRNIEAIRRAFALEREQRAATPEERDVLRAYSGFGAIKEVLEPLPHKKKTALTPLIEELHAVLKENRVYMVTQTLPTNRPMPWKASMRRRTSRS